MCIMFSRHYYQVGGECHDDAKVLPGGTSTNEGQAPTSSPWRVKTRVSLPVGIASHMEVQPETSTWSPPVTAGDCRLIQVGCQSSSGRGDQSLEERATSLPWVATRVGGLRNLVLEPRRTEATRYFDPNVPLDGRVRA